MMEKPRTLTLFKIEQHLARYKNEIKSHEKNSYIITIIYLTCSVVGIVLQTTVSFMLGSKSISNVRNTFNFVAFIFNMAGTIIISVINFLKLETKINNHERTINEYENLVSDIERGMAPSIIIEKEKSINNNAPSKCF